MVGIHLLPRDVLRYIFDALPDDQTDAFDESEPGTAVSGVRSSDARALAATCKELNEFYRLAYVRSLQYARKVTPERLSRDLLRYPGVDQLCITSGGPVLDVIAFRLATPLRTRAAMRDVSVYKEGSMSGMSKLCMYSFPSLRVLRLTYCLPIRDREMKRIISSLAHSLEVLDLDSTSLTAVKDSTWRQFWRLRNLRSLDLSRSIGAVPECAFYAISQLAQLEELRLRANQSLTDALAREILPSMRYLRVLDVSRCRFLSSAVWQVLPESLRSLNVGKTSILHDGCSASELSRLQFLTDFNAWESIHLTEWCILSGVAGQLRALHLGWSSLTDSCAADVIPQMSNLILLELDRCDLVGDIVAHAAARLPRLRTLIMSGTNITQRGVHALAQGPCAATLTFVDLSCCDALLDKEGLASVLYASLTASPKSVEIW